MSLLLCRRRAAVNASTPPDPEPPYDPWRSQEPSGATRLWEPDEWPDPETDPNGIYADITGTRYVDTGSGVNRLGDLFDTPTAPRKAVSVGQRYRSGAAAQPTMQILSMPGDTTFGSNYVRLYTCVVFRYNAGFVFHPNGVKQFYNSLNDGSGVWGDNNFEITAAPVGDVDSGEFVYRCTSYVTPATNFSSNIDSTPLATGVWHMAQIELVAGDPDTANGEVRIWVSSYVDDAWTTPTLRLEHTNVKTTRSTFTKAWAKVNLNGYFGGSGGTNLSADQYHLVNAVYVSGKTS